MSALTDHDIAGQAYGRAAYLRGYQWQLERDVACGRITRHNADVNLEEMARRWSLSEIVEWAKHTGIEPIWEELPPVLGPWYPRLNPRISSSGSTVTPHRHWREYAGEKCEHRWIVLQWSGYDCNDCCRHFGAW